VWRLGGKLFGQRFHVNKMPFFKRPFPNAVLFGVMILAQANDPAVVWLHTHTATRSGPNVSRFDR